MMFYYVDEEQGPIIPLVICNGWGFFQNAAIFKAFVDRFEHLTVFSPTQS